VPKLLLFLHNPLSYKSLRPICPFINWVCFFKTHPSNRLGFRYSDLGFPTEGRLWFCFFKQRSVKHAFRHVIPHLMRNPKTSTTLDSCFHRNDKTITQYAIRITQYAIRAKLALFFQNPQRDLGAKYNWLCLALNWLCFFADSKRENLHNHLSNRHLRPFWTFINWVCFFNLTTNLHEKTPITCTKSALFCIL